MALSVTLLTKGVGGAGPETVRLGSSEALSMCGTGLVSTAEWLEAATRTLAWRWRGSWHEALEYRETRMLTTTALANSTLTLLKAPALAECWVHLVCMVLKQAEAPCLLKAC